MTGPDVGQLARFSNASLINGTRVSRPSWHSLASPCGPRAAHTTNRYSHVAKREERKTRNSPKSKEGGTQKSLGDGSDAMRSLPFRSSEEKTKKLYFLSLSLSLSLSLFPPPPPPPRTPQMRSFYPPNCGTSTYLGFFWSCCCDGDGDGDGDGALVLNFLKLEALPPRFSSSSTTSATATSVAEDETIPAAAAAAAVAEAEAEAAAAAAAAGGEEKEEEEE